jgi:hypothetical protein
MSACVRLCVDIVVWLSLISYLFFNRRMRGDWDVRVWLVYAYGQHCEQCSVISGHWKEAVKSLHGMHLLFYRSNIQFQSFVCLFVCLFVFSSLL